MPEYKLYYFPLRARAEGIRLLLNFKGIPFEDVRVSQEEWPKKKSEFAFGQMPILEVDGKQIAHSWSIMRYLGNKYDLAGKDEQEKVVLDQIMETYRDFWDQIKPYLMVTLGHQTGDKEKLRDEVFVPALERFFPFLERFLKESGSGFFVKSGPSYADFFIGDNLFSLHHFEKEIFEGKYKSFIDYYEKVYALPELQKYLSTRPKTVW